MASNAVPLKTVRLIALNVNNQKQNMRIVNVLTTAPPAHEYPQYTQSAGAPVAGEFPTYMVGATGGNAIKGLPNVYVPAYTGPV